MDKAEKKYKLGLVLSGGGAKAFAHLGVIKALNERGITPDVVSGTSAGAIVGAFICDGWKPDEIFTLFHRASFRDFTDLILPYKGFSNTNKIRTALGRYLRAKRFEDLKMPLYVNASDFDNGVTRIFSQGDLIFPIEAACSIPIVYTPKVIEGVNYVDGGLFKNLPVSHIRDMCDKIIGVNIMPMIGKTNIRSIKGMAERVITVIINSNTKEDKGLCDILIEPMDLVKYSIYDVNSSKKMFKIGYDAAVEYFKNNPDIDALVK